MPPRAIRRTVTAALAAAVLTPALAVSTAVGAYAATGSPAAAKSPAVEVCGQGSALVRPGSMVLACADNGEQAENLHWSSWTATGATATGAVAWRAAAAAGAKDGGQWDSAAARITLTDPVSEPGGAVLFTKLRLHVTGATPRGFLRDLSFDEAPVPSAGAATQSAASPTTARPSASAHAVPQAASGSLSYAHIEGFWIDAGGPSSVAETAAAITGAESSFLPGEIQEGVDYCGSGSDRAGWGLWQITCGNSTPAYGIDFQLLDPWNNAESAVHKYNAAIAAGENGFQPWSTYEDGAYESYLQNTAADTALTDPGEYVQDGSTPPGTPSSPAAAPGSTYGPPLSGGSSGVRTAFEANTDGLWTASGTVGTNEELGMAPGTNPAYVGLTGGGYEEAFQANTGTLWFANGSAGVNTGLGMMPGTSPAITALPGNSFEVAFQANNGDLWTANAQGVGTDEELGMAAGTSPSIASLSNGTVRTAFQANTGGLWTASGSVGSNEELGMAANTNPSIVGLPNGQFEVAFQANTGGLWTSIGTVGTNDELGMAPDTSPGIAVQSNGTVEVAFQANTNGLWTAVGTAGSNEELGMEPGTSPAIIALPGGQFEVAFEANTGGLWTSIGTVGTNDELGMASGTSPAIAEN